MDIELQLKQIVNQLIEISERITDEVKVFKEKLGTCAVDEIEIETQTDTFIRSIKFIYDKSKHLSRFLWKKIIKKNALIISKSSLKIHKNKEKKHVINQIIQKLKKKNLPTLKNLIPNFEFSHLSKSNLNELPENHINSNEPLQNTLELITKIKCYVCKKDTKKLHFFYDQLCLECGLFNYAKRFQKGDLTGKIALLTGGRIKIGYQIALILLRNNCFVYITSRFPKDALLRFSLEKDFLQWKNRLKIYGLDFRNLTSIKTFCYDLKNMIPKLDILINNACQTIRRHPLFYQNLQAIENSIISEEFQDILNEKYLCHTLK